MFYVVSQLRPANHLKNIQALNRIHFESLITSFPFSFSYKYNLQFSIFEWQIKAGGAL
jgi:hypothetical protein